MTRRRRPDQRPAASAAAGSRPTAKVAAGSDRPVQGELFCPVCNGQGVIAAESLDRHGEPVTVPAICPACRPRASSREVWLAAARLGQRLAAGAPR
jgi:hypothetical protein